MYAYIEGSHISEQMMAAMESMLVLVLLCLLDSLLFQV